MVSNTLDKTKTYNIRYYTNGLLNGNTVIEVHEYDAHENNILYKRTDFTNGDVTWSTRHDYFYNCVEVIDDLGLSDLSVNRLEMYPNPATDEITIEVLENTNVVIFDLTGAQVMSSVLTTGSNQLNVSELKNGMYIVRLANGQHTKLLKK